MFITELLSCFSNHPVFQGDAWIISLHEAENLLLVGGARKKCLSMLKTIRDRHLDLQGNPVSMFVLQTLVLYECEKHPREEDWEEAHIGDRISGILMQLISCLQCRRYCFIIVIVIVIVVIIIFSVIIIPPLPGAPTTSSLPWICSAASRPPPLITPPSSPGGSLESSSPTARPLSTFESLESSSITTRPLSSSEFLKSSSEEIKFPMQWPQNPVMAHYTNYSLVNQNGPSLQAIQEGSFWSTSGSSCTILSSLLYSFVWPTLKVDFTLSYSLQFT